MITAKPPTIKKNGIEIPLPVLTSVITSPGVAVGFGVFVII